MGGGRTIAAQVEQASELGTKVLRAVSRSFYLSLRVLPTGFREPASLGYLLARISDTIADTEAVPVAVRVRLMGEFCALVEGGGAGEGAALEARLTEEFVPLQTHEGEQVLLRNSASCLNWLAVIPGWQRDHICRLLAHITEGQQWDLERFAGDGVVRLEEGSELERYAYLVAGSVGEFWTDLGFGLDDGFSECPREELRTRGRQFGMGLQLVNILRDVPEDLHKGRCYLPGDGGVDPDDLLRTMTPWLTKAQDWMGEGLRYAGAVHGRRIRFASGLPALLGLRTLALLEGATWEELTARVKIGRSMVRRCGWQALVASMAPGPERWR